MGTNFRVHVETKVKQSNKVASRSTSDHSSPQYLPPSLPQSLTYLNTMISQNNGQRQTTESSYVSVSTVSDSTVDQIVILEPVVCDTKIVISQHVDEDHQSLKALTVTSSPSSDVELEEQPPNRRRVITRVERRAPRMVSHLETDMVELSGKVIKEYEFEEQVSVGYTGIREDILEHIVAVPITMEEINRHAVPQTVVEVEKPVVVERIIETPQIEIIEKLVEVPTSSGRQHKTYNYIPKKRIVPQERKVYIERPVEKIIEVDQITYNDREEVIETIEVPEYQDVITVKELRVPTVVEVAREVMEERDEFTNIPVMIPVGVEAETTVTYTVPTIVEKRVSRGYPVYVPRFIEVPTSSISLNKDQRAKSNVIIAELKELEVSNALDGKIISACEIEKLGVAARHHQSCIQGHFDAGDLKKSLMNNFIGRNSSSEDLGEAKSKGVEGYYCHNNIMGQWNRINFPVEGSSTAAKTTYVSTHRS